VFTDYAVGDDPQRRCPDISKARELLGWEPTVDLEEGLLQTIEYFRSEIALQECIA
jgi:nucleoside-diphosphate-sugar epimerase